MGPDIVDRQFWETKAHAAISRVTSMALRGAGFCEIRSGAASAGELSQAAATVKRAQDTATSS
jgi:hypothetical protein